MKQRVLLFALIVFGSISVFAQQEETKYLSKGQWMLGGTMSLSISDDFINPPNFSISPGGAYFIGNRWALGADLGYSIFDLNFFDPMTGEQYSNTVSYLSAAPFARYYIGTKKFAPFVEGGYGLNWYYSDGSKTSESQTYKIGAGLNYFVSRNVALEGVVRYAKTIDSYYDGSFGLDLGLQFFFSRKNDAESVEEENYISKGQWLIGGSGNISLGTPEELDFNQFSISPMGGYFVGQKIVLGLSTGYSYYKGTSQSLYLLPFARYYFTQNKLAPFAEVAYGGSWARLEYAGSDGEVVEKISGTGYRIGTGLNYFISRNVALEGNLRYARNTDADSGTLNLSAGLQFFIR